MPGLITSSLVTAAGADLLPNLPQGELALRLKSTSRNGQILRVRSPKISIGSSPHCTVRLRGIGVAPVHCFIVRGNKNTVVRRWAADTRLNDQQFDNAVLAPGDRLAVGPVEFEVIADVPGGKVVAIETAPEIEEQLASQSGESPNDLNAPPNELLETTDNDGSAGSAQNEAERVDSQRKANEQAGQRTRWLLEQLRTARKQMQELELFVAAQRQEKENHQQRSTLFGDEVQNLTAQCRLLEHSCADKEQVIAVQKQELNALSIKLSVQQATAKTESDLLSQQCSELSARIAELQQNRDLLESDQGQRNETLRQLQSQLDEQRAEIDRRNSALAEQERRLTEREQQLAAKTTDLEHQSAEHQQAIEQTKVAQLAEVENQQSAWQAEQARRSAELDRRQSQIEKSQTATTEQQAALKRQQLELTDLQTSLNQQQRLLEERRALLDSDRKALESQRLQLEDQTKRIEEQSQSQTALTQRQQEVDAELARLQEQQQQVAQREAAIENQRQQLDSDRKKLESEWSELAALRQQHAQEVEQLKLADATGRQTWEQELAAQEAALNQRSAELDERAEALARKAAELDSHLQQAEMARAQPAAIAATTVEKSAAPAAMQTPLTEDAATTAGKSTSTEGSSSAPEESEDDVFARLRALSLLKSDDSTSGDAPKASGLPKRDSANVGQTPEPPHGEESIDDYMAKLLNRMRGITGEAIASPARQSDSTQNLNVSSDKSAVLMDDAITEDSSAESGQRIQRSKNANLEPRTQAPERNHDMAAMREIANFTSRAAIAKHQRRSVKKLVWSSLLLAIMGLAAGLFLVWCDPEANSPFFFAGLTGLIISVLWFSKSGVLAKRARSAKWKKQHDSGIAATKTVQPAEVQHVHTTDTQKTSSESVNHA